MSKRKIGAIILAAGKGKRMNSKKINKVAMHLANKPMILHTVHMLEKIKVDIILVVVGFAKSSVMNLLNGGVVFVEQKKRLGTGHAVFTALKKLPGDIEDVLVLNGDDSAFYTTGVVKELIKTHVRTDADFTFLTIEKDNPQGLGRVIRDKNGAIQAVVEEKDATRKQKEIKEVNPACYVFKTSFLKHFLKKIHRSPVTREYYLTSLIDMGIKNKRRIETLRLGPLAWRGINTKEELQEAETLFLQINKD